MLKAGVIGAGHLGKIHLTLLQQSDVYELVGFYDADPKRSQALAEKEGFIPFASPEALIAAVDVVDIVAPTPAHFDLAQKRPLRRVNIFLLKNPSPKPWTRRRP